jgi:hypothetical protein
LNNRNGAGPWLRAVSVCAGCELASIPRSLQCRPRDGRRGDPAYPAWYKIYKVSSREVLRCTAAAQCPQVRRLARQTLYAKGGFVQCAMQLFANPAATAKPCPGTYRPVWPCAGGRKLACVGSCYISGPSNDGSLG